MMSQMTRDRRAMHGVECSRMPLHLPLSICVLPLFFLLKRGKETSPTLLNCHPYRSVVINDPLKRGTDQSLKNYLGPALRTSSLGSANCWKFFLKRSDSSAAWR